MRAFYKIENNQVQVGSGIVIPSGFIEYLVGQEPTELIEILALELEAKRIQDIKVKAGEIIYSRYSIEKQSTAKLGIYGQEYLDTMVAFIKDIIEQSNRLELDKTKTLEDFVIIEI